MIVAGVLICFRGVANPTPVITPEEEDPAKEANEPANPKPWEDNYWEYYEN